MDHTLLIANLGYFGTLLLALATLLALLHLQERATSRTVAHRLGWRAVLVTGWLGVPAHELSHLLAARLFGHRIVAWKLFEPDPVTGTLGYVRHACSRHTTWQRLGNLFIAIAPVVGGGALLLALLAWMLPAAELALLLDRAMSLGASTPDLTAPLSRLPSFGLDLVSSVWRHRGPLLPLQIYLGICIACHMAPSGADLRSALGGLLLLVLLLTGAAVAAALWHVSLAGTLVLIAPLSVLWLGASLFQALYVAGIALAGRLSRQRGGGGLRQPLCTGYRGATRERR